MVGSFALGAVAVESLHAQAKLPAYVIAEAGRYCDLIVAMMVDRLIAPRSKLGFVRAVDDETATTSLGDVLGLGHVREREAEMPLGQAVLDTPLPGKEPIQRLIARMACWCLLYDVTSSYFEGQH